MPVLMNTAIIEPMILPSRLAESMFATAELIEKNTIGTTSVNMKLMNSAPKGLRTTARSPSTSPMIAPRTIPDNTKMGNR